MSELHGSVFSDFRVGNCSPKCFVFVKDGQTALMLAVTHRNVELVKLLLAAKADSSMQDAVCIEQD